MTVTIAWRDRDEIFLIADSALTYPGGGGPAHPLSAVGEPQGYGAFRVEESGAKIVPLTPSAIATYSGDSQEAFRALHQLRDLLVRRAPVLDALQIVVRNFEHAEPFSLVLAAHSEGHDELWLVEPTSPTAVLRSIYEDSQVLVCGSLPAAADETIQQLVSTLSTLKELAGNPNRLLASAVIGMQSLGQRAPLFQSGAGGTFFGARLSRGRVLFQDDLVYALYDRDNLTPPAPTGPLLLFSGVRRTGVLVSCSSVTEGYRVFITSLLRDTPSDIDALMQGMIRRHKGRLPLRASHYAFIDRATGAAAHVYSSSQYPGKFLRSSRFDLEVRPMLRDLLLSFPVTPIVDPATRIPHLYLEDS